MKFINKYKSVNFNLRKKGHKIKYIVLHYTAIKSDYVAIQRLISKNNRVSSHFLINQTRKFVPNEKTFIKYKTVQTNSRFNNFNTNQNISSISQKNWSSINNQVYFSNRSDQQKKLIIYSYSLSYNLLKEIISKLNLNITLTKEIKKASLIIGLKKHLQQNQKLQYLAKQKKIPIYVVNRSSIYQITKLIQFIVS